MGFELNAYYVQDKTGTLYELVEQKDKQVAIQNVATLNVTIHSDKWAESNLRLLRTAMAEDEIPKEWVA